MEPKIREIEPQLAQKLDKSLKNILHELRYFIPEYYRSRVSLVDASGRKKRSSASADNWSPKSDRIEIWFEPVLSAEVEAKFAAPVNSQNDSSLPQQSESDLLKCLLKALDEAESIPGWKFVPLRKFRDEILPLAHMEFVHTDVERQSVLRSAIEKRLILVGKVPNPKAPEFPVTTVRLNRLLPEVQRLLGREKSHDTDFSPVEIRGESLSATILRERR